MNGQPLKSEFSLSVIVPAHNAAATLPACLDALEASDVPLLEVILVDDASTDGAPQEHAQRQSVRVVRTGGQPQGPAHARNLAAKNATGQVLVFVDADVAVHADAIRRLVQPILHEQGVVATFGSYDDNPPAPAVASRYANLRHHFVHQRGDREAHTFWAGLGAVAAEAYREVDGFDAGYGRPSIEDVDLGTRLRRAGRICLLPDAQGTHLKAWTLRQLWRTDIFARALPWARLSAERPELLKGLNASASQKLGALLLAVAAAMMLATVALLAWASEAAVWTAAAATLPAIGWVWINRGLLCLLWKRGGPRTLIGGAALHAIYYVYCLAAFAFVAIEIRLPARIGASGSRHRQA